MGAPYRVVQSRGCTRPKVRDLTTLTITEQSLSGHKHSFSVVERMRNSQPPRNPVDLHGLPLSISGWSQGCSLELSAPAQGARPSGNLVEGCSPHARQPPIELIRHTTWVCATKCHSHVVTGTKQSLKMGHWTVVVHETHHPTLP